MEIQKNIWLNLQRNDRAVKEIQANGSTKLPYFKISLPPQEEGGEWTEIGVAWKGKKEGAYGFKFTENVKVIVDKKEQLAPLPQD